MAAKLTLINNKKVLLMLKSKKTTKIFGKIVDDDLRTWLKKWEKMFYRRALKKLLT